MGTIDQFTVDLVSNGSLDVYQDNSLSKFQNKIDPQLELDGEWEVALTEIYFPLKFELPEINVQFQVVTRKAYIYEDAIKTRLMESNWLSTSDGVPEKLTISTGESIDNVVKKINRQIDLRLEKYDASEEFKATRAAWYTLPKFFYENGKVSFTMGCSFTYGIGNEMVRVETAEDGAQQYIVYNDHQLIGNKFYKPGSTEGYIKTEHHYAVEFSDSSILDFFGFYQTPHIFLQKFSWINHSFSAESPPQMIDRKDLKAVFLMYIYTDIIRDHTFCGGKAPVLRAVPLTKGMYQDIGYCTFEHRIYYPVRKNLIENIAILLTHDTGEQVKFESTGRVFLSLDFRRKK
jgi:hypothetical protein